MRRHRYALIVLLAAGLAPAAQGQPPLAPEAGVLVLRNGQVIEGAVTRAGDYYVVTLGQSGEIRLPVTDVESLCGSLAEAYEFKRRHLSGSGAKPHLDLAEWCLRHRLHSKCAEQLIAAMRLEPDNPRLKQLETRLQLASEEHVETDKTAASVATVSAEQLDKTLRELPKGSVEKFGAIVQPILLNRCGANKCHGPNAESEFRLLRPPAGQIASRRFTQRNLYSSLKYLDQDNPEASPLVAMPQRRHGTALTAVFDRHSEGQLNELIAWAKLTIAPPAPSPAPTTIAAPETTLSQPAPSNTAPAQSDPGGSTSENPEKPLATKDVSMRVMRPTFGSAADGRAPVAAPLPPAPRDRFDPEIFNRRYHGAK